MDTHRARPAARSRRPPCPSVARSRPRPPVPELWAAVDGLPAKQREAVLRRYVADLPYADIAVAMGTRPTRPGATCSKDSAS